MVKIKDLSNAQFVEQLTKYIKIVESLYEEREIRVKKGVERFELLTDIEKEKILEEERDAEAYANDQKTTSSMFQLKITSEEIDALKEAHGVRPLEEGEKVQDEELEAATKLINIAKKLEELKKLGKMDEYNLLEKERTLSVLPSAKKRKIHRPKKKSK